jgi:cytochrome c peroxidase
LFYDVRLSDNQTQSCASCHRQELAFSDGRGTGLGSTGELHLRGPMSLANLAYTPSLTWANPLLSMQADSDAMQRQVETPLYGTVPIELGMKSQVELEERLGAVPEYRTRFAETFAGEAEPLTGLNIARAIAAFERTLISGSSPYDRFERGDASALGDSAQRGYELFFGERLECFHCHSAPFFTDHFHYAGKALIELKYHNTGLYNVDGQGAYPAGNTGVHTITGRPADMGMFKAPTLRNIAKTAPYMHDGSIATLSEVLDHYAAGGRTLREGPNVGVGSRNPRKDRLIRGFSLSEQERADVIAFLESLTDEAFLTDPAFSNPWP